MDVKVVSSHYNEDLSWTSRVRYPVEVFSKSILNDNHIEFNKVQEAPSYLKFIINNYYNLPDYTFFVHGHEFSEHQTDSIVNLINDTTFKFDFTNLNRKDWYVIFDEFTIIEKYKKEWGWIINNWESLFSSYLPLPKKLVFPCCAQFCVSKKLIKNNPLEFYKKAYAWCELTSLQNSISGRIFEYTWHYIFTHKEEYQIF